MSRDAATRRCTARWACAIGDLLSCNRDGTFVEGYNPSIKMDREHTIMQGHGRCTFRYRIEPQSD